MHLRVCPQRSSHPLGACVFEDGEGARGGKFIKGGFFGGSHDASRAQGGTKLERFLFDLIKGPPTDFAEFLHRRCVRAKVFTFAHCVFVSVFLEGMLREFMKRRHTLHVTNL